MSRQNLHKKINKELKEFYADIESASESASQSALNEDNNINLITPVESEFDEQINVEFLVEVEENSLNFHNSSDSSDAEDLENKTTFLEKLAKWSISHNITRECGNELLNILKEIDPSLPSDIRTIRKTPSCNTISNLSNGTYMHYGLKNCLTDFCCKNDKIITSTLFLQVGIDGIPISPNSSKSEFWPILVNVVNYPDVYAVGCFHGESKPKNSSLFLNEFVADCKDLLRDGFNFNNRLYKIEIHSFICDAPARSFVLQIKGHTGFYSCPKCVQKGLWVQNRMTFPNIESEARTDVSFLNRSQPEHHKFLDKLPLEHLNIGCVSQFPLDYMHVVCLGVMRQLLSLWVKPKKRNSTNIVLSVDQKDVLNSRLFIIKSCVPSEFNRKLRPLNHLEHWKANELKLFLLYVGPVILKGVLDDERYTHFLKLSCGIRILLNVKDCVQNNECALLLLKAFVSDFTRLYDSYNLTYNSHNILHLANEAIRFGSLENISAFKFENKLQEIKKLIHCGRYPLSQLFNRIVERSTWLNNISSESNNFKSLRGEIITLFLKTYCVSVRSPNNFCSVKERIFKILKIHQRGLEFLLFGKYITSPLCSIFVNPLRSSNFKVFTSISSNITYSETIEHRAEEISFKYMSLIVEDNHYFLPLNHTKTS